MQLMLQATVCDCLALDPFAFEEDGFGSSEVDVGRGKIVEALVIAGMVVMSHEGLSRVVGVRDILSWSEDPARRFAARRDRAGLAALARHNLVFDLMVYASQLGEAARMVSDFPNQLFVLNHCGSPIDRDAEGMRRWREGLATVAHSPNVLIKISDLVAYDHNWTLNSLREVVLYCIDSFGPERAMFASDFPVTGLHATFEQTYGAFKTIVSDFSADEQRAIFFDNAKRTYRIDLECA